MWSTQPFEGSGRITPLDTGIYEHVSQSRKARKRARVDLARSICDRLLFELVRRHCGRDRKHIHRRDHAISFA
jgi:hypothetical protein